VTSRFPIRVPQHGVRGRRRVDCIGRMVMRPSDWEIASQSAFYNPILIFQHFSFQRFNSCFGAFVKQPRHRADHFTS